MGLDFKFLVRTNVQDDERPDTEFWWQEREVETALEEAGRRIREIRNVLALEPNEAFPIVETLRDTMVVTPDHRALIQHQPDYIKQLQYQQGSRILQRLIEAKLIEFSLTTNNDNSINMIAMLKVQKINR